MNTITFHYTDRTRTLGYGVSSSGLSLVQDLHDRQTVVATFTDAAQGQIFRSALELIATSTVTRPSLFKEIFG
jgi:uncharacterized membrane protein YjjP (DUF1212 family)